MVTNGKNHDRMDTDYIVVSHDTLKKQHDLLIAILTLLRKQLGYEPLQTGNRKRKGERYQSADGSVDS